jgi:hypothetical protein
VEEDTSKKRRETERKGKKNWSTLRRREVILSKVSIYIVFMFISCHRYSSILLSWPERKHFKSLLRTKQISIFRKTFPILRNSDIVNITESPATINVFLCTL